MNLELPGIEQALKQGLEVYGITSGSGLRVVNIEDKGQVKAWGQSAHVEEALIIAAEDFLQKKEMHVSYLTGSTSTTSPLDHLLRKGGLFRCFQEPEGKIVCKLRDFEEYRVPEEVYERAKRNKSRVAQNTSRGFLYSTLYSPVAKRWWQTDEGFATKVLKFPEGKTLVNAFSYYVMQIGLGENFWDAIDQAFAAEKIELSSRKEFFKR